MTAGADPVVCANAFEAATAATGNAEASKVRRRITAGIPELVFVVRLYLPPRISQSPPVTSKRASLSCFRPGVRVSALGGFGVHRRDDEVPRARRERLDDVRRHAGVVDGELLVVVARRFAPVRA